MSEQLNIQGSSGRCISSGTARGSDISTTANLHDKWPNNAGAHVDVSGTHTMRYSILETPPWPETMLLGLQQYMIMMTTAIMPYICVPLMGGGPVDVTNAICTIFFASGIVTLLQTLIGDRLPLIQGGSSAYVVPALTIAARIKATGHFANDHERFLVTMREVQGGIIGSGLIIAFLGMSGAIKPLLRLVGPITAAVNIGTLGLSFYSIAFPGIVSCPQLGITMMMLFILFSQYLKGVTVRLPGLKIGHGGRLPIFELFPIVLSLSLCWIFGWILTISGAYNQSSPAVQAACRVDQSYVMHDAPWFRVPYPWQWGAVTFSWASTLTMLAGALPAMLEALGGYYAAAEICGAPVPPPGVISRAITLQGLSCTLAGALGTTTGTTAYSENMAAMQMTRVASRRVIQIASIVGILFGVIGKVGAIFAAIPHAIMAGLLSVLISVIVGVGLSLMRHADLSSSRNIFVLGFSMFMTISISSYFAGSIDKIGISLIKTGFAVADDILNSVFSVAPAVGLLISIFLDNTIPGSDAERGLTVWQTLLTDSDSAPLDWWEDDHLNRVYGLPFNGTRMFQRHVGVPLRSWTAAWVCTPLGRAVAPLRTAVGAVRTKMACSRSCQSSSCDHSALPLNHNQRIVLQPSLSSNEMPPSLSLHMIGSPAAGIAGHCRHNSFTIQMPK